MQKVLITGGTGFLGSHITKRLVDNVESITIVTTDIRQQTTLKSLGVDVDKINLVKGDVRDFDFLRLLFNEKIPPKNITREPIQIQITKGLW